MSWIRLGSTVLTFIFVNALAYVFIVFTPVHAISNSMRSTIVPGDWVLVRHTTLRHELTSLLGRTSVRDRVPFQIAPGDLILYTVPSERSVSSRGAILKRVVGVPGDTLESRSSDLRVNGEGLAWSDSISTPDLESNWGPVQIPEVEDQFSPLNHSRTPLATGFLKRGSTLPTSVRIRTPLYFVVGDNPAHSIDSRDVGLIPETHIQGVARRVLFSKSEDGIRWGRTMREIGP